MVKPRCSNFRMITANISDVWIFRMFTVCSNLLPLYNSHGRLSRRGICEKKFYSGSILPSWAASWQNQQNDCAPSLLRVFAVRSMGSLGPKLSSCRLQRLWLDWTDHHQQPRLILVFAGRSCHFVGFVMMRQLNRDNGEVTMYRSYWESQN